MNLYIYIISFKFPILLSTYLRSNIVVLITMHFFNNIETLLISNDGKYLFLRASIKQSKQNTKERNEPVSSGDKQKEGKVCYYYPFNFILSQSNFLPA